LVNQARRFIACLREVLYGDEKTTAETAPAPDQNGPVQESSPQGASPEGLETGPQRASGENPASGEAAAQEIDMGFGILVISTALIGAGLGLSRIRVPYQERELFEAVAQEQNVDPDLLHAIAWQESGINSQAISPPNRDQSRDWGMMQINERNFTLLGLNQLTALEPGRNVRAAASLIQRIGTGGVKYSADILSIYNAGDARFKPYGSGPRLRRGKYTNQNYVTSAMGKLTLVRLANIVPLLRAP